jgi:hypothetical protein
LKQTLIAGTDYKGGRAPHGARGLKPYLFSSAMKCRMGRAPHGARGLKQEWLDSLHKESNPSRLPRGAWIETLCSALTVLLLTRRAPHGARGLKRSPPNPHDPATRRAPHGARGLKVFRHMRGTPDRSSRLFYLWNRERDTDGGSAPAVS